MAKLYEQYLALQENYLAKIKSGKFPLEGMLTYQELNYRIDVLGTFKAFCLSAPKSTDMKGIGFHYQMIIAYIRYLQTERPFGLKVDEEGKRKRETAANQFAQVIQDCCKRFSSIKIESEGQYEAAIAKLINTVVPIWLQFRTTFVKIELNNDPNASANNKSETESSNIQDAEMEKALTALCPIQKYIGKTLGEVLSLDPNAIKWLATDYKGDAAIKSAAKTICEYAARKSA